MDCVQCNASGWVCATSGEAIPLPVLVQQLSLKLRSMSAELARAKQAEGGAHEQYEQNNRRGAGASNFTGD
jgi:Na+-translocating ferredoxin:NAD+ oxidoreductase RnfC subunit